MDDNGVSVREKRVAAVRSCKLVIGTLISRDDMVGKRFTGESP